MDNNTIFYICGIALAVSAVTVSFLGLKVKDFPGRAMPLVVLWFAILVVASTTFAVRNGQHEEQARAAEAEQAHQKLEQGATPGPFENEGGAEGGESEEAPGKGAGAAKEAPSAATTLQLAASPTALEFDKTELTANAGKVTIDFENPSAIEHDVAIAQGGKQIAVSELITESKTSVSAELKPGTYTFLCTVPGHAQAGMEGKLVVK